MANDGGLRIGSFVGAAIVIDSSLVLLAAYVLGTALLDAGFSGLPGAGAFLLVLLLAVVVHEFAHAGVAAALKIPSKRIVLTFFGGYVQFAWTPKARWHEIAVSAAGPIANLICWQIASLVAHGVAPNTPASWVISQFAYVNLLLGAFNLLPGLPLDGGHVLRAALNYFMPRARAWFGAALVGLLVAAGIGAYAFTRGAWWTLMVALLLGLAAWGEAQRSRRAMAGDVQPPPSTTSNA